MERRQNKQENNHNNKQTLEIGRVHQLMQALVALHPASQRASGANNDEQIDVPSRTNLHLAAEQQRNPNANAWLAARTGRVQRGEDFNPFGRPANAQNQARETELDCSDIPRIIHLPLPAYRGDDSQVPVENGARPTVRRLDDWQSLTSVVDVKRLRASLHVSNHSIPGKPVALTAAPQLSQTLTAQIPMAENFGPVLSNKSISGGEASACALPALTTGTGVSSVARPLPLPPAFPNPQVESKLIQPLSLASCDNEKSPQPGGGMATTPHDHSSRDCPAPSRSCSLIDWNCNGKPLFGSARNFPQPTSGGSLEQADNEPLVSRMHSQCEDREGDRSSSRQESRRSPSSSTP